VGWENALRVHFEFETSIGQGVGVATLSVDSEPARCHALYTELEELQRVCPTDPGNRRPDLGFERDSPARRGRVSPATVTFTDHEPEVLVVGGGQSGVQVAAQLERYGIDTLVVDRFPRIGDNWRTRYDTWHSIPLRI